MPGSSLAVARESITFRPQTDEDIPFLLELYASTRADEMKIVPWTDQQKQDFVQMQFNAQKLHYERHYPQSDFFVIEKDAERIGRIYINRCAEEILVIDITLHPLFRNTGIGSTLLRELMDEAKDAKRPVHVHVESFNPAQRLYQRLDFKQVNTYGVYHLLEWRAADAG